MRKLFDLLNPFGRLGDTHYSFIFPLLANIFLCILSEFYAYKIAHDPFVIGNYIIFLNAAFIIYFSLRDSLVGGFTSLVITIIYYFYIIYTRHFQGHTLQAGIDTTVSLGIVYIFLALVVGILKRSVDLLIEKEANGRRHLETIIEQLPVGVIIADKKGNIIQINKQLEKIIGKDFPTGFVLGEDLLFPGVRSGRNRLTPTEVPLVQALKGKSIDKEYIVPQEEGIKALAIKSNPVRNNKGEIIAAVQIISDITAQKELEQRRNDFINMASHELKTPLTSVKVFTQVLEKQLEKQKDEKSKDLIQRINTQLNKLTILVGDLLDVTRLQEGKLQVIKEKFLIRELAEDVIKDLQPISSHKLILQWTTRLPVVGDRERLRQVLTNLVTNAIKYSPENSEIILGSRRNKNMLEVYVKDFGVGVVKSEQKKIFNRFYQVAEHSTYPGLGLGLYISSLIIKQHKGKIWVESEKGKGSIFWFSLPISKN